MIPFDLVIYTSRFRLRIPSESDIDFVFSATRYPGFNEGMQWEAPDHKEELLLPLAGNLDSWNQGDAYAFTIESKDQDPTRLGRISIRRTAEEGTWHVGFWTHPARQGKGIMTEALGGILEFGFEVLKAKKIRSRYAIWNKASERVLIKNGFKFVRHLEEGFKKRAGWIGENELELTAGQWRKTEPEKGDCYFCQVLKGNKNTLFEDDQVIALLDIDPISLGHIIICPKEHFTDFHELPDETIRRMMILAKEYLLVLIKLFPTKGYSMMLNGGSFNDLKHAHVHVFPRSSKVEFQWVYAEEVHADATKFEVLKKLIRTYLPEKTE